jgi:hypothetical protein
MRPQPLHFSWSLRPRGADRSGMSPGRIRPAEPRAQEN